MLLHTIIYAFYCEVIQMAIGHVRSVVNRTLLSLSVSICLGISTQSYAQQDTTDLPIMNSSILVSSAAAGGADASEAYTFQFIYDQAVKTDNKELLALISAATSDKERAMLAGELTPDRSGMTVKGALISQDLFARAVQRRTSDFLFGDSARSSFWGGYLGGELNHYAATDNMNRFDGFNADMSGFAFGFDKSVANNIVIGVAFSNQNVKAESRLLNKTIDIDSYQSALYGTMSWEYLVISGRALVGWNANQTDRLIGEGSDHIEKLDAHGRFNSISTSLQFDIQSPIYWNQFDFSPILSVSYSWIKAEEYQENYEREYDKKGNLVLNSGSPAALNYDAQVYDELNIGLGFVGGFSHNINGGVISIRSGIYADYEVLNQDLTSTVRLVSGGDKFTVAVNPYADQQYRSFVELGWESNTAWSLNVGGEYQWGDQQDGYLFFGKAVYSF